MPHSRPRHALKLALKKLKFARVVSLQGARQTGKSFLARELLPVHLKAAHYVTLDRASDRRFAQDNPDTFLSKHEDARPLMVDEAQKAPDLFDAVKVRVDESPGPGQYLLLGSTEFSREAQIRESLTGRLSKVKIYPFNIAETLELPPNPSKHVALMNTKSRASRKDILRMLENGGFPGIFSVRDSTEQESLWRDWLSLVSQRDILQFKKAHPDPELVADLLPLIASSEVPEVAVFAKRLGVGARRIQNHLKLLEQLFAVIALRPHPLGSGKLRYFLCDPGLAHTLGASFHRCLTTWALLEQLSQRSYRGDPTPRFSYYRSSRGGTIDLVIESRTTKAPSVAAIKVIEKEKIDLREFEILRSFAKKLSDKKSPLKPTLIATGPFTESGKIDSIELWPWESVV